VVVSSETAGRLLGIATTTPSVVEMMEDLLTPEEGFAIAEREVETSEIGGSPRHLSDIVLGVVRAGVLARVGEPEVDSLEAGDKLLYEEIENQARQKIQVPIVIKERAIITGDMLERAQGSIDGQTQQPVVSFKFNAQGARRFADITRDNVGHRFAAVLDE